MTKVLCLGLILTLSAAAPAGQDQPAGSDINTANKKLGRGINLGNALEAPAEGAWGVTLKAGYFKAIKDAGFDTVRLPVRWSAHAGESSPYTLDPKFAARVDWAVEQALANHLNIILNVHHYDAMDAEPDANLARLESIWKQIAVRYRQRPPAVYFELFNEPHGKFVDAKWNAAIPKLLAAVRVSNPTRPVIVGPPFWNAIWALDKLELPTEDRNLIVTVHYYDPFQFTHQGAPWAKGADKWKGRQWTGARAEEDAIRKAFAKAAAWGQSHQRPMFLGEFGAYQQADMKSRSRWTRFVAREAERQGFSWAYWEFCSGFGAYDPQIDAWRAPLKSALVPKL
jgi:endoglucanase